MNCKFCGAAWIYTMHAPTAQGEGRYRFKCGTSLENGEWYRSRQCMMDCEGRDLTAEIEDLDEDQLPF